MVESGAYIGVFEPDVWGKQLDPVGNPEPNLPLLVVVVGPFRIDRAAVQLELADLRIEREILGINSKLRISPISEDRPSPNCPSEIVRGLKF